MKTGPKEEELGLFEAYLSGAGLLIFGTLATMTLPLVWDIYNGAKRKLLEQPESPEGAELG